MISDELRNGVVNLVREELAMANKKYPLFTSNHEGYAVIKEELEECQEVLDKAAVEFAEMWRSIRKDSRCGGTAIVGRLFFIAVAAEAIQAAAMMEKFIKSEDARFAETK